MNKEHKTKAGEFFPRRFEVILKPYRENSNIKTS